MLRALPQVVLVLSIVIIIAWFVKNVSNNLNELGSSISFKFITQNSGLHISGSWLDYSSTDSYLYAYIIGVANTLTVAFVVIIASTIIGFIIAIGRISSILIIRSLCLCFVEVHRNIPIPVHLLFWYYAATAALPGPRDPIIPTPGIYATIRGFFIPFFRVEGGLEKFWLVFILGILVFIIASKTLLSVDCIRRRSIIRWMLSFTFGIGIIILGMYLTSVSVTISIPHHSGRAIEGGIGLSPEFALLTVALTLYSSALSGEVIRGGILSVPKGQAEAGRALNMKHSDIMVKIIMPQALRVIIPPMTNQYISIVKYTTLAMIIGYNDVSSIVSAVIDRTSRAVEGVSVLMATYFAIGLLISVVMGIVNARLLYPRQ